jgi:hypothetical protein
MRIRTTFSVLTFRHAFFVSGVAQALPAGTYEIATDDESPQCRAVLDRLRGALRHHRQHGVAGIAQQCDATFRPLRPLGAIVQRPEGFGNASMRRRTIGYRPS